MNELILWLKANPNKASATHQRSDRAHDPRQRLHGRDFGSSDCGRARNGRAGDHVCWKPGNRGDQADDLRPGAAGVRWHVAAAGRPRSTAIALPQQLGQPGKIRRHPPGLILEQHTGRVSHQGISSKIEPSDRLTTGVLDPKGFGVFDDSPGRRGKRRPVIARPARNARVPGSSPGCLDS
jgi:hypothetical protein